MNRNAFGFLQTWLVSSDRKPLVIRGARQVGKTWLVRYFAEASKRKLIEINFEKNPSYINLFASNDPKQILLNLSTIYNQPIDVANSLLFLDEIQAAPEILSKLRWFAEDLPEFPVVAAGSLLEFVLAEYSFSMPVGRINYMYLEPLSFEEFLWASGKKTLSDYLNVYHFDVVIPEAIHQQLMILFKEYLIVGGLPAAVLSWITERALHKVNQIQNDLLATYRDDFAKYKSRVAIERLDEVMMAVPKMLGQKFISSRVSTSIQSSTVKKILDLFSKARICHRIQGCSANGLPFGAEIKDKYFKEIFLDTGLCMTALGLGFTQVNVVQEIIFINQGGIAEQVVGQMLRTIQPFYIEPHLYYWQREEATSNAEVDYIIQHGNKVVPVEVKAGSTGGLKSLHLFMGLKKLSVAVRVNSDLPTKTPISVKDHAGNSISYLLLSVPFYLVGQLNRLLSENES